MNPSISLQILSFSHLLENYLNNCIGKSTSSLYFLFHYSNFDHFSGWAFYSCYCVHFCRTFTTDMVPKFFISNCLSDIPTWASQSLPNTTYIKLNYLFSQVCSCFCIPVSIALQLLIMELWVSLPWICLLYPSPYPTLQPISRHYLFYLSPYFRFYSLSILHTTTKEILLRAIFSSFPLLKLLEKVSPLDKA